MSKYSPLEQILDTIEVNCYQPEGYRDGEREFWTNFVQKQLNRTREWERERIANIIKESLSSYRLQYIKDEEGDSLHLVDVLTPDYEDNITMGLQEIDHLADHINAEILREY